jgi:hypothetical protein
MYTNFGSGGWSIRNNSGSNVMYLTNGGSVGIGTGIPDSQLTIVGGGTNGNGIGVSVNSAAGSSIYAQQDGDGWAGYFSGRVNINDNLTLQGRIKPLSISVCRVGTDTCYGKYLYTSGTTESDMKYWYWKTSTKTIEYVVVLALNQCPSGYNLIQANNSGTSYYLAGDCSDEEGASNPYRAAPTNVCQKSTALPKEYTNSYRTTGGACNNSGPVYRAFWTILAAGTNQIYELR